MIQKKPPHRLTRAYHLCFTIYPGEVSDKRDTIDIIDNESSRRKHRDFVLRHIFVAKHVICRLRAVAIFNDVHELLCVDNR